MPKNARISHKSIAFLCSGFLAASGCQEDSQQGSSSWIAERDTAGGAVIVRTLSGSVWGQPATLVEELAIGVLEGEEEKQFGRIQEIAPDERGGVYVFDGQVPALRYFDSTGAYVRTLGGKGAGPGEYQDAVLGLAVRTDGRIVLRDPRNARLNVYDPDGTSADTWPVASGLFAARALRLDTTDQMYLKILLKRPEPEEPWKIGLLHLDASGNVIDTIPDPSIESEPERMGGLFLPAKHWDWSPLGYFVIGVSEEYRFEIRRPGKPVTVVKRVVEPVPVRPEEKAEWDAYNEWLWEKQGQFMTAELPPIPDTKAPYGGIFVGQNGRVWIHRHVLAEKKDDGQLHRRGLEDAPPVTWRDPNVYDVFEPDGTYLGEVWVPPRTRIAVMSGDTVWGVRRGDFDEEYVVRLRIALDAQPTTQTN